MANGDEIDRIAQRIIEANTPSMQDRLDFALGQLGKVFDKKLGEHLGYCLILWPKNEPGLHGFVSDATTRELIQRLRTVREDMKSGKLRGDQDDARIVLA